MAFFFSVAKSSQTTFSHILAIFDSNPGNATVDLTVAPVFILALRRAQAILRLDTFSIFELSFHFSYVSSYTPISAIRYRPFALPPGLSQISHTSEFRMIPSVPFSA